MSDDEWIIGWDYNHLYDSYDWDAVEALFGPGTVADVKRRYYVSAGRIGWSNILS